MDRNRNSYRMANLNISKSENPKSDHGSNEFLIVGLGASAGGIQALREFFANVPSDSGNAYVVILHLSPNHDSQLSEVLRVDSKIPVTKVTEKTVVQPDNAYVISPNQHLVMMDGFVSVSENITIEDRRAPVDIFFRTLAESHGPRAVCVVLSGTGANGSMGLKRIKEFGGAAYVQNPLEAEYNEMPRNAIETELVDEILPVGKIPGQIMMYKHGQGIVKIANEPEVRPKEQQQALREIFSQLRLHTGHDFSNYKRPTLLRRIERRINIRNLPNLPAYATFLQEFPDEIVALLRDLLISVTNFFRDVKPFQVLETEVIPAILRGKNSEDNIRIWVAGCATGEEVYSIAMLFCEHTMGAIDAPRLQIFATDIDESAIAIAREGLYTINDAADVSPARLARFFNKEGDEYRIRREIREMILFANHNFLKDPPFSRLNLVACRNVLIYLNHTAQERVMETFHFALNPGGFLFLGSSESIEGANDLYATFNRENHIFQSRQVTSRHYPVPESIPSFRFNPIEQLQKGELKEPTSQERITFGELHQRLLEEYAPPSVVVNEEYDVVHMTDNAGKFFEFSGGEPTQNLLRLVKPELRIELRSALYQAVQRKTAIEAKNLKFQLNDKIRSINIQVRPVLQEDNVTKGFILVIFEEQPLEEELKTIPLSLEEPVAKHLEEELIRAKNQLRNYVEHHESQAEELKASNEELQAMNEELRSAAEELETSKEELQSINEELRTVNQELKVKIEETNLSANNLQNLINAADVGTIFLDRNFQIKLFTPAVSNIFNLIPSDLGRPITDITNKIVDTDLLEDAKTVLEKLSVVDREIATSDHHHYVMRLLPYRTTEDRVDGIIITFFDITKRRLAEGALKESEERFRTLTDAVPQLIWANDKNGKAVYFNQRWYEYSGLTYKDSVGMGWQAIVHPNDESSSSEKWREALRQGKIFDTEYRLRDAKGNYSWHIGRSIPYKDASGNVTGWFGSATDIEKLKGAEESYRNIADRLQLALEAGKMGSYEYNFATGEILGTPHYLALYGYAENEKPTIENLKSIVLPADLPSVESAFAKSIEEKKIYTSEYRIQPKESEVRWIKSVGRILFGANNEPQKMVGIAVDVTEQKVFAEELSRQVTQRTMELRESNEDLIQFAHVASHDLKEPVRKIQIFNRRLLDEFSEALPETAKSYVEKIDQATSRMFSMIQGVLSYSTYGTLEALFVPVDLNNVIAQVESDLEVVLKEKKGAINRAKLPVVQGNAILLYQLFSNLINNSLKFSRRDTPSIINITHSTVQKDARTYLEIKLADNGIGFENEYNLKIFESFSRLNSKDEFEGTGLGLSLCKKIVERHHGLIFANAKQGVGAVFTILLPI